MRASPDAVNGTDFLNLQEDGNKSELVKTLAGGETVSQHTGTYYRGSRDRESAHGPPQRLISQIKTTGISE